MSKVAELKKWRQEVLLPWQQAAEAFNDKQAQQVAKLKRHAPELKTMVALILDGKTVQAADLWNSLGFEPALRGLQLTDGDVLQLSLLDGSVQEVALDDLLADLGRLVSA